MPMTDESVQHPQRLRSTQSWCKEDVGKGARYRVRHIPRHNWHTMLAQALAQEVHAVQQSHPSGGQHRRTQMENFACTSTCTGGARCAANSPKWGQHRRTQMDNFACVSMCTGGARCAAIS